MPPKQNKKPKGGKGKKGGKKAKAPIDWAADPHFDERRVMLYIELTDECPIFLVKAEEFVKYLMDRFPEKIFHLILNEDGKIQGRPGAFEIKMSQNARTETIELWSGIDKGPPRRDKFPASYDLLLPDIERLLRKIYVQQKAERHSSVTFADMDDDDGGGGLNLQDATEGDTTT